ncbi:class I SAM-dependent methyltransferase [Rhodococcus sp. A14]|uniref:methyltransferase domain-containing protein n=1 Tax=Rhodococcus sp. A14 TaxID=1194106 RepID=UPI00141EB331|nr:class I SAM-dependent methyltransferase [Rhodococcus sp. A14]
MRSTALDAVRPIQSVPDTGMSPRAFFEWFHSEAPDVTSGAFARGRTSDSLSSYEVALRAWHGIHAPNTVLDLGCGEGHLSKVLAQQWAETAVISVDFARYPTATHLPLRCCADGGSLPIADDSIDLVVCHLSIHLFDRPNQALQEIARVLRPGGVVSIILPGTQPRNGIMQKYRQKIHQLAHDGHLRSHLVPPPPSLRQLRNALNVAGFRKISDQGFVLNLDGSAEDVWRFVATTYDWPRLDKAGWEELYLFCARLISQSVTHRLRFNLTSIRAQKC